MKRLPAILAGLLLAGTLSAQWSMPSASPADRAAERLRTADNILLYQRVTGGWPKNTSMNGTLTPQQQAQVLRDKNRTDDSTVDNNATTSQLSTLAQIYAETHEPRFREGFLKGVEYLLSGQYENGGWPQFWPDPKDYQVNITFNDNNMSNILGLFRSICDQTAPYDGDLTDEALRTRLEDAWQRGIDCILRTQIVIGKKPTVWCQQNDPVTLAPAPGRAFELASFCSAESVRLVQLLMRIEHPDKRVKAAVHGAMEWFDRYKITGYRQSRKTVGGESIACLVEDPGASPIWARFYDLEHCEPFVCDRDGLPRRRLEDIGRERRNGYSWFNGNANALYDAYAAWVKANDPGYKVKVSATSKGGNETGLFRMFRRPVPDARNFDVVVKPGESIQAAIDKAPADAPEGNWFRILVRRGTYHESFNVNKPRVMLIGEDREETTVELSEATAPAGAAQDGTVVRIAEAGTDFIMSGFTLRNGFDASPADPGQPQSLQHRMVVQGRADRTIIVNCTITSNGNDALALWAPGGNGMYYHADLDIRTPGVDFICPRGWCYATRCHFYGDSRAMIWHDGRGDPDKKFVITNSDFDAASPTLLGRYHHDALIYILHSRMSANVLDQHIHYAYSDQVKDPCVWGERFYFYNNVREGGHSGWLANNLDRAPIGSADLFLRSEKGKPLDHWECTAVWTFGNRWDPEAVLRSQWGIMAY